MTDAGIIQLIAFPALTSLGVTNVPLRGSCLPALGKSTRLKDIGFDKTKISFEQIARGFGDSATALWISVDRMHQQGVPFIRLINPIDSAGLEHLQHYRRLQSLVLDGPPLDLSRLGCLEPLAALRSLEINGIALRDDHAELLGRLKQLRTLGLNGRQAMSLRGFQQLARMTGLTELRLHSSGLTDEQLAFVAQLTNLEVLDISGNPITSAGLEHLQNLSRLRRLGMSFCRAIDDDGFAKLKGLKCLEDLSAQETQVTDAGLVHLFGMPRLRHVTVLGSRATKDGLKALRGALTIKGGTIY